MSKRNRLAFFRLSKKSCYRDERNKKYQINKKAIIIVIAGDTSNITCYLSLFSVSSLIVPLYADRLETKKYHCLFESLSACRLFIDTLKGAKIAPFRLSKKPRYRDEKIKANNKTSNRHIIITAGDTSNITCCLSLFSVSSLIVPLYAYRRR